MGARAIDAWVNVRFAGQPWQQQAAEAFHLPDDALRAYTPAELLALMDPLAIEKAIIGVNGDAPEKDVLAFVDQHPDRFALAAHLDPRRGMKTVRALAALVRSHRVAAVRLIPCLWNAAPDDRIYYPIYAKAIELGIPVCVTTGIPAPPLPARCQDPIAFDEVCRFFPELVVVMANGADPWWNVAIRLLAKFPNLHLMTSACAPGHWPAELIAYMNGRGADKIIFATDFPFLTAERCLTEVRALELRPEIVDKFLHANAARVFFGGAP